MKRFNAELLVLAREARGLTQIELATRIGISQSIVSKYENDLHEPPVEHLALFSKALDLPQSFFERADTPLSAEHCLHHRKQMTAPAREVKQIRAIVRMIRLHLAKLLDGAHLSPALSFPRYDIADYDYDPTRVAILVRRAWRIPSGPVRDTIATIERAGGIVARVDFETRRVAALAHSEVPPLFCINASMPADRVRFTLAHEIGHLVMHHAPTENQEREADGFAAEFLMPATDVGPDLDNITLERAAQLKPHWRVSMQSLIRRARDLKCITQDRYERLMTQVSKRGWRLNEPVELPREEPALLREMITVHESELGYSRSELAVLMDLNEPEFRARFLEERWVPRVLS